MTRKGGGSGEPPPPSGQEWQCARTRFEQIQRGVKAVAGGANVAVWLVENA